MFIRLAYKNPNYIHSDKTVPYFTLPKDYLGSLDEPEFIINCGNQYLEQLFCWNNERFYSLFTQEKSFDLGYDKIDIFNAKFTVDINRYPNQHGYGNWHQLNFENCNYLVVYNEAEGASRGGTDFMKWYNLKYYWITQYKYVGDGLIEYTLLLDEWVSEYWKIYGYQIESDKIKGELEVKRKHCSRFYWNTDGTINFNYNLDSDVFLDDPEVAMYNNKTFSQTQTLIKYWTKDLLSISQYIDVFAIRNDRWQDTTSRIDYKKGTTWFLLGIVNISEKTTIPPFKRTGTLGDKAVSPLPLPFYFVPLSYTGNIPDDMTEWKNNTYDNLVLEGGDNGFLSHIILTDNPIATFDNIKNPIELKVKDNLTVRAFQMENFYPASETNAEIIDDGAERFKFFDNLNIRDNIDKLDFTKLRDYKLEPKLYMEKHFHYEYVKFGQKPYIINTELLMRDTSFQTLTNDFQIQCQIVFTPSLQNYYYTPSVGYYKNSCNYTFKNSKLISTDGSVMMLSNAYIQYMNSSKYTMNNNYLNARWSDAESWLNPMSYPRQIGQWASGSYGNAFRTEQNKLDAFINDLENTPSKLTGSSSNDAYNYLSLSFANANIINNDKTSVININCIPIDQQILVSNHYNQKGYILNRQFIINNSDDYKKILENRTIFNYIEIYKIMNTFNKQNICTQIVEKLNQKFHDGLTLWMPIPIDVTIPWIETTFVWNINHYSNENVEYDVYKKLNPHTDKFKISSPLGTMDWKKVG